MLSCYSIHGILHDSRHEMYYDCHQLQEYILYSILDNVTVPLTCTTMLQYILEGVPAGVPLLYQVAAVSRNGREGTLSTPVEVSGESEPWNE